MMQGREGREVVDPIREALSALVDGEADAAGAADGVSRWRDDDDAKTTWHAYQLIGDVLRSEDLAAGHRDRVFMQRLHARLIQEPTVLAPAPDVPQANPDVSHAGHVGVLHRWAVPLMFNSFDTNKDGSLSRQEASTSSLLASQFDQLDKNGDGKLSVDELGAADAPRSAARSN